MGNLTDIYAMPNSTDTGGIFELFRYINNIQRIGEADPIGLFFPVMLLCIFLISFISLLIYSYTRGEPSASRAFAFSSFFCTVLGIMLSTLGFLSQQWMYLTIFMTAIGAVWLILENARG